MVRKNSMPVVQKGDTERKNKKKNKNKGCANIKNIEWQKTVSREIAW